MPCRRSRPLSCVLVALKIGKLAAGAGDYYTAMVADGAEEYYTTTREAPGEWVGSTAQRLGLAGTVRPDDFTPVIEHRCDDLVISRCGSTPARIHDAGFILRCRTGGMEGVAIFKEPGFDEVRERVTRALGANREL